MVSRKSAQIVSRRETAPRLSYLLARLRIALRDRQPRVECWRTALQSVQVEIASSDTRPAAPRTARDRLSAETHRRAFRLDCPVTEIDGRA